MKYALLQEHLEILVTDVWETNFAELERILGFALPASARRYPAWWANQSGGSRPHAKAWLDVGWRTRDVRIRERRVTFVRGGVTAERTHPSRAARQSPTTAAERGTPPQVLGSRGARVEAEPNEVLVVALVACAKTKSAHPTKAKDLYISPLFRKSREYVERHGWRWYVLSALHGLVDPEAVIEPYERSFPGANRAARQEWASNVLRALESVLPDRARLILLAGERYSEFIVPALVARGHQVEQPLKGLRLGQRLALLGDLKTGAATRSGVETRDTSGPNRWSAQPSSADKLSPVHREHYEVARSFEGFFERAEFLVRYQEFYSQRSPGSIIPSDYCFNRENKGNTRHPRFLWWDGGNSYVFVGLHGAPKEFLPVRSTETTESFGHSDRASGPRVDFASPPEVRAKDLRVDIDRGRALAEHLHRTFLPSGGGIFGEHQMPEDILPAGLATGSREQLLFLMLTVSVDYMRDASELWCSAREAWAAAGTRYLFEPQTVVAAGYDIVERDLKACGLSRKTRRDALAWFTIARALADRWSGDPRSFLEDCGYHAPTILHRIYDDRHLEHGRWRPDFPLLRGPKIAPLWIRMLRDNAGIELSGLDEIPIPVDVHVLRATLCAGVLHGRFVGSATEIFEQVRRVWRDGTRGLRLPDGRAMVALDVDEALWTLSRLGCSKRGNGPLGACPSGCPAAPGCVAGTVLLQGGRCEVNTHVSA